MRIASATTATGTFTKNTQRQPARSVIRPPITGPTTLDAPHTMPLSAWYLPRSRAGNTSAITANDIDMSAPPPSPCTTRSATSWTMLLLKPAATEASEKSTTPAMSTCLRPMTSDSRP